MEKSKNIKIKCLFCFSDQFVIDKEMSLLKGHSIQCANCGRYNDYYSLLQVAKRKSLEWIKKQLEDEMKKVFGK